MLWVALHLPRLPPGTLEHVAAWACQFTPRVSLEPPQGLLLEVEGSLRLFGGLERLLERLREGLDAMELTTQFAVAPAARAALWRSRGGGARLEELPLEVIGFDFGGFFGNIGISTVGELLKLPREGLARRCGQALLDDLDRALSTAPEAREYFLPPPRFAAKLELPAEVSHADGLLFAARRLLVQLEGLLAARHAGVRGFTLTLLQSEASTVVEVQLASPAREAGRLGRLLREKLATLSLSCPVEAIRLEAGDFSPLHARTAGMFGDALAEDESWGRLAERLAARRARRMGSARVQASRPAPAMAAPGAAPDARRRSAAARRPRAHRVRLVGRRRGAARLLHRPLFRFFPGLGLPRSRRMVPAWPVCLTTPSCTACRISASCAALRTPRSWWSAPRRSATRRSPSPTNARSPAP